MLSLEEKQAILIEKWKVIHKLVTKPHSDLDRADWTDWSDKKIPEKAIEKISRAIWEASGRDLKTIVPPGVKNSNWYLLNLKGTIEWHGNVGIGEDSRFTGWFNVVPPSGVTISYFGPGAIDKARETAKKLMSYS